MNHYEIEILLTVAAMIVFIAVIGISEWWESRDSRQWWAREKEIRGAAWKPFPMPQMLGAPTGDAGHVALKYKLRGERLSVRGTITAGNTIMTVPDEPFIVYVDGIDIHPYLTSLDRKQRVWPGHTITATCDYQLDDEAVIGDMNIQVRPLQGRSRR